MTAARPNGKLDAHFEALKAWREESVELRWIVLGSGLDEVMKWGQPCYAFDGQNVVVIHGFKAYCALLFFKGALMKDPDGLLVRQTENVQSARQMRFSGIDDIRAGRARIAAYVEEAIAIERAGLKVAFKQTSEFPMPEEFRIRLDGEPELRAAFARLTPGRQRAYLLFFAGAKQVATRQARVEKHAGRILAGKGLDDAD